MQLAIAAKSVFADDDVAAKGVGGQRYSLVVLPSMVTLSSLAVLTMAQLAVARTEGITVVAKRQAGTLGAMSVETET